jgi:hypothetical protein
VVAGTGEAGGDEQRADLIAVEADCVRLVVQAWTPNMHGG